MFLSACQSKEHKFLIGVSQCSDDEWRTQMNMEIMREAFMYDGVTVEILTANDNSKKQVDDIRYFINKKVDLLIVAPNEGDAMTPIVEETYKNGIPVVVVDRKILSNKYTAYIGADNFKIGEAVGSYIAARYNGKGNVIEISGLSNSTPAIERHDGFMRALNKYPEISVLCCEDAGWHRSKAKHTVDSILKIYPQTDIIFAHNDRMAAGAYDATIKTGRQNDINFIGIDALPGTGNGVEMVQNKILDATFIYPTGGDKVLQTAMDILLKRPYEKETILNTAVIDSLNANVMMLQTSQINDMNKKVEKLNGKISNYLSQYATQQVILYGSLLILFLVAGLLIIASKALSVKNKLNLKLSEQKEQLENQYNQLVELSQKLEEATHAKLVFFTNISHDFRTPLTLVSDPVEQLLKDPTINENQHKYLLLVKNNVAILLRLVNQILDFRKYENGKMDLTLSSINILECIEKWNESFQSASRKKHIHFSFNPEPDIDYSTTADIEKLERIYFNLLSNALKFTPENGKITLTLSKISIDNTPYHRFTVLNTGSLITEEHIRSIFERFYKIDKHHSGSGIGLALVKAFVEMHGGIINVESNPATGTTFTIDLPIINNIDINMPIPASSTFQEIPEFIDEEETVEVSYDSAKPTILIIDDNPDIRTYIHSILNLEYSVIEASNGADGIKKAMKYIPDVILSDVMMPGIDGVECCRRLKNELQTCHIPVILLTACAHAEQRVLGYAGGADSYISKPFNADLLIARIKNLIESKKRLQRFFGDSQSLVKEDICDIDKDFARKFKSLIESKMSQPDLNIEDLGKEMGLSRVQLYRKIKSLTNFAPNELLRIARLKRATSLLSSSNMTIAEICYEVGFSSPSYFTKCYKEQYGESPTDYLKRTK